MTPSKDIGVVSEDRCGKNTQNEDIQWLASLAEHELDFLISLKELATIRAKNIGHRDLAHKFDIKVLRALAFVLFEYFKDRVRNTLDVPADSILGSLNCCRLLDLNSDITPVAVTPTTKSSIKSAGFVSSKRKRMCDGVEGGSTSSNKEQKNY